jgi:hypothetical protein
MYGAAQNKRTVNMLSAVPDDDAERNPLFRGMTVYQNGKGGVLSLHLLYPVSEDCVTPK